MFGICNATHDASPAHDMHRIKGDFIYRQIDADERQRRGGSKP
jgi:hypothetical protein